MIIRCARSTHWRTRVEAGKGLFNTLDATAVAHRSRRRSCGELSCHRQSARCPASARGRSSGTRNCRSAGSYAWRVSTRWPGSPWHRATGLTVETAGHSVSSRARALGGTGVCSESKAPCCGGTCRANTAQDTAPCGEQSARIRMKCNGPPRHVVGSPLPELPHQHASWCSGARSCERGDQKMMTEEPTSRCAFSVPGPASPVR